ncbi:MULTISPECIES: TIGR03749 family integrating conjugative element protein [unclassified Brenneria]|uniref:TIGR03749 family integrating conjugative element protein n=1 Tax=unclassified Brenneria TaxID=2634434 RepID=UPI0029C17EC3|nr:MULTISPECIES: TIGR03749 family integrating conjugative element protein [unclassified Brenneria]MDX5628659.1 TIGR03749 family integrating conjugative element protein [Brenneria sp. L3-3Z]MDX5695798.1 TIGR03749 family integrating conjugative element protein [Brenneria sp. L4-2C]
MKKVILPLLLLFCPFFATATELVQWQRIPLPVELHVGHERVLLINKNVRVGYPAELGDKLRIQSSGGTVYLRASKPFTDTRLQLHDVESGELILLDVRAADGDALEPLELRYDEAVYRNDIPDRPDTEAPADSVAETPFPVPVALTRYAAQMLYAPLRTVEPVVGIRQAPARLPATVTTLLPTEPVTATPLAAWQLDGYAVTAIRLQNRSPGRIHLDPRALQGAFVAATFQHDWIGAQGTPQDTTVAYLVTDGGADHAILPEPPAVEKGNKGAKR